ncbi:hypothetical protein L3X38_042960 [Prunus dulcis]|uniref:U1-type domain-containing protein n=1 Tax=Prunus dulcis TaxID=3755 RepID=A0AAD4UVY1_PRUDU|nr:hypothetical protein L3X38_042960 [Prunus dulcis]
MGFVLLEFALQCFTLLAWPLLAWVYPLCCSVRAIENNSISDSQMLNTYWLVLSLILLFEHALLKLLEWLLLWQYIRIMIAYWLVIPHFDGAVYVYKHLICPCLTMDPQIVINWFNKRRNEPSCIRESFLAELERYVQENGPEALERIVACKVIQTKHNLTGTGNSKFAAMEIKEKAIEVVADRNIMKTPPLNEVQKGWTFNSHLDSKNLKNAIEAPKARNQAEPRLTQIGNGALAAVEASVNPVEIATGREIIESSQNVPKEWTRALEVTIPSERTLNSNLIRIHKASHEALNAKRQAYVPKMALAKSDKHEEPGKSILSVASKPKVIINREVQAEEPENSIPSSGSKPKWIINQKVQVEEPENSIPRSGVKTKVIINRKVQAGKPEQSIPSSGSKPKIIINRKLQAEEPENSIQSSGLKPKVIIIRKVQAEEPENSIPSSGVKPKVIINRKVQTGEPEQSIPSSGSKSKIIINRNVQAEEPENSIQSSGLKPKVIIIRKAQAEEPENSILSSGSRPRWIIKRKVHADEPESSIPSSGSKSKWIIGRKVHADEPENTVPGSRSKPKVIINRKVQAAEEPSGGISSNELKRKLIVTLKGKVQGQQQNPNEASRMKDHRVWCKICNVHFPGEIDLASHLSGRKHEENVLQQHKANSGLRMNGPPLWCKICDVSCCTEFDTVSHRNGMRHLHRLLTGM